MDKLIIGRKSRNRKLYSIIFFLSFFFMLLQGIKAHDLLVIVLSFLHLIIAFLILKYAKNTVQLKYNKKSKIIIVKKNNKLTSIELTAIKQLNDIGSFSLNSRLSKQITNFQIQLVNETKVEKNYIFFIYNNDTKAIQNLNVLKKDIILIRHKRAKLYTQAKRNERK